MNVCKNEGYAESFVQECQVYCDNVYEKMQDMSVEQEQTLNRKIYEAMVYKVGSVDMTLWCNCCQVDFKKKDPEFGPTFIKRVQWSSVILMGIQILVSGINSFFEVFFYANLDHQKDISYITDHCKTYSLPFAIVQAILGLSVIYLLLVEL